MVRVIALATSLIALSMQCLRPANASVDAQVQSYAEMVCGTNLKTGNLEEPEVKQRCIDGLRALGSQSFKLAASSIQKCKGYPNFLTCIKGHTSDTDRIKQRARAHSREIRSMSLTPHHLYSPRLEKLGLTIKKVLGPRSIKWSNGSQTLGCKGKSLYGYYNITRGFVVMCQGFHKGDLIELVDTLKHEGWHAVQHQCRKGSPYLSNQEIASRILEEDLFNLHSYHPKQKQLESEARIMAKIGDKQWIGLVREQCRGKEKSLYKPNLGVPYKPF